MSNCICPTLHWNKTCNTKGWFRHDANIWLIEQMYKLYQRIEKLSLLLARWETLFTSDDVIAHKSVER